MTARVSLNECFTFVKRPEQQFEGDRVWFSPAKSRVGVVSGPRYARDRRIEGLCAAENTAKKREEKEKAQSFE